MLMLRIPCLASGMMTDAETNHMHHAAGWAAARQTTACSASDDIWWHCRQLASCSPDACGMPATALARVQASRQVVLETDLGALVRCQRSVKAWHGCVPEAARAGTT